MHRFAIATLAIGLTTLASAWADEPALSGASMDNSVAPCWQDCETSDLELTFLSDRAFEGFIEPVTNPIYSEDPRSRTRARVLFLNQSIPEDSILAGGDAQVYAAQVSVALNDRWAVIINKGWWMTIQSGAGPHTKGWLDLATGLKYVIVRDPENQFLLSGGLLYEWSQGSSEVFQGNGSGWSPFLTMGKEFGECGEWHFIATGNWRLPNDTAQESTSLLYSMHLDRKLTDKLYALVELNGIHYTKSGSRLAGVSTEGGDLVNLGAGNVTGNDFISMAAGATYKLNNNVQLGGAWEVPITGRKDLMEDKLTVFLSLIY